MRCSRCRCSASRRGAEYDFLRTSPRATSGSRTTGGCHGRIVIPITFATAARRGGRRLVARPDRRASMGRCLSPPCCSSWRGVDVVVCGLPAAGVAGRRQQEGRPNRGWHEPVNLIVVTSPDSRSTPARPRRHRESPAPRWRLRARRRTATACRPTRGDPTGGARLRHVARAAVTWKTKSRLRGQPAGRVAGEACAAAERVVNKVDDSTCAVILDVVVLRGPSSPASSSTSSAIRSTATSPRSASVHPPQGRREYRTTMGASTAACGRPFPSRIRRSRSAQLEPRRRQTVRLRGRSNFPDTQAADVRPRRSGARRRAV